MTKPIQEGVQPRTERPLGVYVHFPFCLHRCPYCDFNLRVVRNIPHEAYTEAILKELDARAERFKGRRLVSIYFGGGTPGLWEPECVERVIKAIEGRWPLLNDPADQALAKAEGQRRALEVTLEINPCQAPPELLERFRQVGVNRLSVGVQSFDAGYLQALGRDHDHAQAHQTLLDAQAGGWGRVSMDLLFGGPHQSLEQFQADLDKVAALGAVEHVSAYSLIIEPTTLFGRRHREGRLPHADDEAMVAFLDLCQQRLEAAGLRRYEISSYGRPGREARHNSLYWTGGEYMGLGVGAHEFALDVDGTPVRRAGAKRYQDYVADPAGSAQFEERLDAATHLSERAYLGLRTLFGISLDQLRTQFEASLVDGLAQKLQDLQREGYVALKAPGEVLPGPSYLWSDTPYYIPTERGMLFADDLSMELL